VGISTNNKKYHKISERILMEMKQQISTLQCSALGSPPSPEKISEISKRISMEMKQQISRRNIGNIKRISALPLGSSNYLRVF